MAGGAEMPAFAGKRQQIFVAAGLASHAGKTQMQVPAVQIPVNHILDIGSKKIVSALVAFFPDHFQIFEMVLHALKRRWRTVRHGNSLMKKNIVFALIIIFLCIAGVLAYFVFAPAVSNDAKSWAYSALAETNGRQPENGTLIIVDFSKPSQTKRLAIIDLEKGGAVFHGRVAHGKNSGLVYASDLSNQMNSLKSSAGLFKVEQLYNGKHGPSYRLEGLDPQLNDNARRRGISIHAGYYVSLKSILLNWKEKFRLGRSHGCFVLSHEGFRKLRGNLDRPAYLYAYGGRDGDGE